jgi:DNA repair protein RecN (Recombination protein N)
MEGRLLEMSAELTAARTSGAAGLCGSVVSELRLLGIPHADFRVSMEPPSTDRSRVVSGVPLCSEGAEVPEFLFSANPGQPPARLSSVASGGEMSRVSLALRLALSSAGDASTMVFDEIDSGIGGETAHALADSLHRAAASGIQVVVITHLAVVASRASTHLAVSKSTDSGKPFTEVRALSGSQRLDELTRILGGGEAARGHAQDLLSRVDG